MSGLLTKVSFDKSRLPDVSTFECGDVGEPWCDDVSNWIKSDEGVLVDMARFKTKVWLYHNAEGQLVGYGSLGISKWEWPDMASPRTKVHHIPYFGVDKAFHGLPAGPPEGRYGAVIIRDLIEEARARHAPDITPIITLFVDERNHPAIKFYRRNEFRDYSEKRLESDVTPGIFNLGMIFLL
jgi:ribosomal protein S18 acetylase RimI-like enzyme